MKVIFKIHWRNEKPLNEMDRNEIIIKWADELIFHSDHLGKINKNSLIPGTFQKPEEIEVWRRNEEGKLRNHVIASLGETKGDLDMQTNEMVSYLEGIRNHLLSHRYIKDPTAPNDDWILSERGWIAKELGGHLKYQQYRKRELNILRNQHLTNIGLIIATCLAATMPFVVAWIFTTKVYNTNVLPAPVYRPAISIDSVLLHQQVDDAIRKKISTMKLKLNIEDSLPK